MSEGDTLSAIEIYREEHETWNVERLMAIFADDAVWQPSGQEAVQGKEAIRKIIERMAASPAKRLMKHTRVIVSGTQAAVEHVVTAIEPDGTERPYRVGANFYEVKDGKITYIRTCSTPVQ